MGNSNEREKSDFGKERVVEVLRHGKRDQLRVSICSYQGRRFVNLRVWFRGTDNVWRPTKTGITFQRAQLDAIIGALEETKRRFDQSANDQRPASDDEHADRIEG